MAEFVRAAGTSEIAPGQAQLVTVKGKEIVLFNVEGAFFALDNACTHEEGPLAEGEVLGHEVTCPWHGATFDIRTGEVLRPPAYEDVARHGNRHRGRGVAINQSGYLGIRQGWLMAKLTRQLHERIRGDNTENRDWWRLIFDTEAKRFYVEHEWSHTDAWRAARSNNGTAEFDINGFLGEGEARAQAELLRIIESVFEEGGGENA